MPDGNFTATKSNFFHKIKVTMLNYFYLNNQRAIFGIYLFWGCCVNRKLKNDPVYAFVSPYIRIFEIQDKTWKTICCIVSSIVYLKNWYILVYHLHHHVILWFVENVFLYCLYYLWCICGKFLLKKQLNKNKCWHEI